MTKKKETTAISTIPAGTVVVPHDYGEHAEKGYENTGQEDYKIPFLNLLQDLNPEVKEEDPKYIEGAKPGMFLNKATGELYDGKKGVVIVPCITQHNFVEWVPIDDGGGFVAQHGIRDKIVMEAKRAAGGKLNALRTPKGNELVDTFLIFALTLDSVDAKEAVGYVVIPFTATKIKHYRDMVHKRRQLTNTPLFANRVLLTSVNDVNKKGQHFKNVKLTAAVGGDLIKSLLAADSNVLKQGAILHDEVRKGMMQANFAAERADAGGEEKDEVFA